MTTNEFEKAVWEALKSWHEEIAARAEYERLWHEVKNRLAAAERERDEWKAEAEAAWARLALEGLA